MASEFSIRHAAHIIRCGGIIAYPTETLYGLGCNPYNARAVKNINRVKRRPPSKHFILLAGHIDQITPLININGTQKHMITQACEPTSWVVDANQQAPAWLTSLEHTLTIRISDNAIVKKLCDVLGHAIISTSANISGKPPAKNSLDIHKYFTHTIDKILATNQKLIAKPSKIIRLCDNFVLRD
ncbi:MAG: threonylcarbamoyl-AMP synthase [Gammaproteobacteria bacterium]|nr:threonylcarbamoyl-AMP synthase [Gammaproteobacteria bacterium]